MFVICLALLSSFVVSSLQNIDPIKNLTITHVWNNLEYWFDAREDYQFAIDNGTYIKEGFKRPYDVETHVNKNGQVRVFITSPRIVRGIPYTLARVSTKSGKYGPKLLPYPDYKSHSERDTPGCDRIISVFRIFVDPCQRLWAIDNGRDFFATPTQVCPPKILVYDLETDKLILKYTIPEGQYIPEQSVHNGIIVDIYDPPPIGRCRRGKAYLTDARGYSFLVFSLERRSSWVIYNELFKPNPDYLNTTIAGETFTFPDGLYTSTPYREKDKIYLHSYASLNEIAARLSVVNNQSLWIDDSSGKQDAFQVIGNRPTQSPTQAKDSKGNMYFSIHDPISILSWDPNTPYEEANFKIVAENSLILQFVAGLKVRLNSKKDEVLIMLTNRLQKLNTGTISLADENFRIMVCRTSTLQSGIGECGCL